MTTWADPSLDMPVDDLPDLTSIVDSPQSVDAVTAVIDEYREADRGLALGALSDEELVACAPVGAEVRPHGTWYASLGDRERRTARATALRSLTTREELYVESGDEGLQARMSLRLMALLRLRREPVVLIAQGMTRQGPSWYQLRRYDDVWLREVVSEHGFHSHDLVPLDEMEEMFFRVFCALGDKPQPSQASFRQSADGLPSRQLRSFLAEQRHVTQLAMVHPGEDVPESYVVCVDQHNAMTIGVPDGDDLVYSGGSAETVVERWRAWRDLW